jgi:asparagine synthase (glutamine-hydrolysing)/putative beta-lactam synthetase
MSGFVGWIDFRRDLTTQEDCFKTMLKTMQNCGPDGGGVWISQNAAFGHRRLSVTDQEGGKQPMSVSMAGALIATVHMGRIYNSCELRRDLETMGRPFSTRSDTEVLLQSYLCWGAECVERLHGMFAFAIWDGRTRQLLLGRDRLGLKPLYYFEYPQGILFASEPKGIMANPLFEARLDWAAIPILLQPRLTLPGETPLAGLREVPPAHIITHSLAGLSSRRFWQLTSKPHSDSPVETARQVRSMLEEIVNSELAADVRVGAMLSGGMDSTSIAALAIKTLKKQDPDRVLNTFCVQFEKDLDYFVASELRPERDAPYAAAAADFIGSVHQTVDISAQDLTEVLPATRQARDLPAWGQFDGSMYLLFKQMRKFCTVALTGEAADEIFGGYPYLFNQKLIQRDHFPWLGDGPKLSDYLSQEVKKNVDPQADERARYERLLSEVPRLDGEDPENARMREVLFLGMSGPLQVVLDRKDRMSAAVGLEVRVPFCDHRLVEYVWNVPWSMKSSGGVKGLLKAAMTDVLPLSTLNRKKSAYPHFQDLNYEQGLIREATRIIEDRHSPLAGLFDVAGLKGLIADLAEKGKANQTFPGGSSPAYMLIHLVEAHRWIEDYGVSV